MYEFLLVQLSTQPDVHVTVYHIVVTYTIAWFSDSQCQLKEVLDCPAEGDSWRGK